MDLATKIRKLRLANNMTQSELASLIGVSQRTIANYEMGSSVPTKGRLPCLAEALGVSQDSLKPFEIKSSRDILEILFQLEKELDLHPSYDDSQLVLRSEMHSPKLDQAMKVWAKQREALDAGEITAEEYEDWKSSFCLPAN